MCNSIYLMCKYDREESYIHIEWVNYILTEDYYINVVEAVSETIHTTHFFGNEDDIESVY